MHSSRDHFPVHYPEQASGIDVPRRTRRHTSPRACIRTPCKQRRVVAVATQPGSRTRRSRPREDDPVTVGVNEHQDPRPAAGLGTFMPDANLRRVLGRSVEIGLVEHHG